MSTALAQAPPADATRQLYEQHSSRIFGFCLSRLGSREEAEDAVQTTFMNAQRGLGRGVVPEYELAWLFKIAQNVCNNRHQSVRRRGRVEATQDLDALQDVVASPERGADVSLEDLTRALGAIPVRQRRALLLREFQGYSYEEIATELRISVSAVETLLFRARRAVAQELERSGVRTRPQRGAVASLIELFRWLFAGSSAPLKLAAATAAVATTAVVPGAAVDKPASLPVSHGPAIVQTHSVSFVPVGKAAENGRRHRVAGVRSSEAAVSVPGSSAPSAVEASSGGAQAGRPSPAPLDPGKSVLPAVSVSDLPAPQVDLPAVTLPTVTVPAVPAVNLPALPLPPVTAPDVQLPDLPKLP